MRPKDLEETLDTVEIKWKNSYSERIRRAFGEPRNAAERAGEGIAILTILAFTKYTAIERAPIGSGFDFWLGLREDADSFIFQRDARMEVKGVSDAEFPSEITREVRKGIKQTKRSDNTWFARICNSYRIQPACYLHGAAMNVKAREVKRLHREAMEFVDESFIVQLEGNRDQFLHLTRLAFEKEVAAADLMVDEEEIEPTRSVLHRGAATLAYRCEMYEEAKRLVYRALAGMPPPDIEEELNDLLGNVKLALSGWQLGKT